MGGIFIKNENETLEIILNDKAFLENVIKMDIENAQRAFKERGIELSTDDMMKIKNLVCKKLENPELISNEILEHVSGGRTTSEKIKNIAYAISSLIIAGTVTTVGYKVNKMADKVNTTIDKANATIDKANERADAARGKSALRLLFWGVPDQQ